jgi:NAD(P)-dependent dehydrogenase (short-subunit alcohol dehydrogenase family)
MEKPKLEGKVAMVTGGASGIGLGIAEKFIQQGASVMVADIHQETMDLVKNRLGDACETVLTDVTVERDLENAVQRTIDRFGRLNIGVNNAGVGGFAFIKDQTLEQWNIILDTCLKGTFLSMKYEARQMISQGKGGVIINIASLNSRQPATGFSAYCSAKAGVEMITKVGAMEMGPHQIRVCGISPGLIDTPATDILMHTPAIYDEYLKNTPLGRSGTTGDIGNAALFLASDDASWVTGITLFVDGGALSKKYPELEKLIPPTE